jgi:hypothetical protein
MHSLTYSIESLMARSGRSALLQLPQLSAVMRWTEAPGGAHELSIVPDSRHTIPSPRPQPRTLPHGTPYPRLGHQIGKPAPYSRHYAQIMKERPTARHPGRVPPGLALPRVSSHRAALGSNLPDGATRQRGQLTLCPRTAPVWHTADYLFMLTDTKAVASLEHRLWGNQWSRGQILSCPGFFRPVAMPTTCPSMHRSTCGARPARSRNVHFRHT